MNKTTLLALADELECATEGSRELDAKIVAVLNGAIVKPYPPPEDYGTHNRWQFWTADGRHFLGSESKFHVPRYTTSVDAAMTLVPKGWGWGGLMQDGEVTLFKSDTTSDAQDITTEAATPALALCAASLRAMAAS